MLPSSKIEKNKQCNSSQKTVSRVGIPERKLKRARRSAPTVLVITHPWLFPPSAAASGLQLLRSQHSSPTHATNHDCTVVEWVAPGVRGGGGVRRHGDGGQRRRHGPCAGQHGGLEGGRRRGRGRARAAAVERSQAVPAVARQLAGEHRAGEPAPPVGATEVQQHHGGGEGPGPRARRGGAVPGAALRHGLLLPLGNCLAALQLLRLHLYL